MSVKKVSKKYTVENTWGEGGLEVRNLKVQKKKAGGCEFDPKNVFRSLLEYEMPPCHALTVCFTCIAAKVFTGKLRINRTFTNGMSDKTSKEFKEISDEIVAEVCKIMLVGLIY